MKTMNHGDYMKKVKKMTDAQLRFTAQDAQEAAEAMPHGENVGYYLDEVNYCLQELARRNELDRKAVAKRAFS